MTFTPPEPPLIVVVLLLLVDPIATVFAAAEVAMLTVLPAVPVLAILTVVAPAPLPIRTVFVPEENQG